MNPQPCLLRHRRRGAILCMVLMSATAFAGDPSEDPVLPHAQTLAASLPEQAQHTLERIADSKRRLLALRSYLKAGMQLTSRWSWTSDQIQRFERSADYDQVLSAIYAVRAEFEEQNPGYTLFVNTNVRPLDVQLDRWQRNSDVAAVADELYAHVARELNTEPASPRRLKKLLLAWYPTRAAPLAAPGLSAHGQLRAVDFQVMKGTKVIAGTSVAAVARMWERSGWAEKLERAVQASGSRFKGPLRNPNEPWHYTYEPQKTQVASVATADPVAPVDGRTGK